MKPLRKQGIILFTVLALVLVACGGAAEETVEETTPEVVESLESPAVTTASTVDTGVGVTAEACPEAILPYSKCMKKLWNLHLHQQKIFWFLVFSISPIQQIDH